MARAYLCPDCKKEENRVKKKEREQAKLSKAAVKRTGGPRTRQQTAQERATVVTKGQDGMSG